MLKNEENSPNNILNTACTQVLNLPQNNTPLPTFINQVFKTLGSVLVVCSPKKFPGKSELING